MLTDNTLAGTITITLGEYALGLGFNLFIHT